MSASLISRSPISRYGYHAKFCQSLSISSGTKIRTVQFGCLSIELRLIYALKTDGQAFCSVDTAPVVGIPEADSSPKRGAAGPQTGSWIDGSTAERDRHPGAAPGVSGGTLQNSFSFP
ncbi:hypothetical protein ILYODFUR_036192 [Ilyodon furcidens]|uniref:Uncharacterized protein n=1 Tax=Ilyodon furcidens TaxID=33524 RepID=A0ABV0T346_9TELE